MGQVLNEPCIPKPGNAGTLYYCDAFVHDLLYIIVGMHTDMCVHIYIYIYVPIYLTLNPKPLNFVVDVVLRLALTRRASSSSVSMSSWTRRSVPGCGSLALRHSQSDQG